MTSRLYRTTRPLAAQVALMAGPPRHKRGGQPNHSRTDRAVCERLDPPRWAPDLKTRVALFLPARAHDALNRLL